jgi:integrase
MARRIRGRRHPGVTLKKPDPVRRIGWRAQYVDPDSGSTVRETVPAALTTAELREDWAVRKSKALALRRLELEGGAHRTTGTSLGDALDQYFKDHPELRPGTVGIYRRAADKFAAWAKTNGVRSADDLTGPKLVAFRAWLVKQPLRVSARGAKRGARKEAGGTRAASSVNRDLRSIGTVLGYLRKLGLLPRINADHLLDGLEKLSEGVERVDFRKPHELGKLLDAALRHDTDTFAATRDEHAGRAKPGTTLRYKPIAPLVAAAVLTGMRAGELVDLDWERVDLEALDGDGKTVGEIYVTAASKTKRARTVGLEVSPALRKLLAQMHVTGGGKGSVFGITRGEAKAAEKRLRGEYGAPAGCNWQALRRTCGTYLTNAPGIFGAASAYRSAKQLGHCGRAALFGRNARDPARRPNAGIRDANREAHDAGDRGGLEPGPPTWRRVIRARSPVIHAERAIFPQCQFAQRQPTCHMYLVVVASRTWPPESAKGLRVFADSYGHREVKSGTSG